MKKLIEKYIGEGKDLKIIPYSKNLDVRNLDSLPRGTGARYLEVIEGEKGAFIAKKWRRKPTGKGILIDLGPKK